MVDYCLLNKESVSNHEDSTTERGNQGAGGVGNEEIENNNDRKVTTAVKKDGLFRSWNKLLGKPSKSCDLSIEHEQEPKTGPSRDNNIV